MSKGKWCRRRLLCSDNGGSRDLIIALAYRLFLSIFKKSFFKFLFPSALVICFRSKKFLDSWRWSFFLLFDCVFYDTFVGDIWRYCAYTRVFVYAFLTSIVEVGVWFVPGIRFSPFDALFIGRRGKRLFGCHGNEG